eukprot:g14965.t1 g14965   contig21:262136-264265(+)
MKLFFLQISALTAVAVSATINNEVTPKQKAALYGKQKQHQQFMQAKKKQEKLQSDPNALLRNFKAVLLQDHVDCDWGTEETCYDNDFNPSSCSLISEGGCPCSEGEIKCGGSEFWSGYCVKAEMCCDDNSEEMCFNEDGTTSCAEFSYQGGGCPCWKGQIKCGADEEWDSPGYCSFGSVCCDYETEETCYDENYNAESCAPHSDGGCPCPSGEERCGAYEGYLGYCTSGACCDYETEETCYDENYNAESCAPYADGGCPCPSGEERCGAYEGYLGYCTSVCCPDDSETCFDENHKPESCAPYADGGCPCPSGEERCGAYEGYLGYCTSDVCCDYETEETCYDENYNAESCAPYADGGCPCPSGEERCGAYEGYLGYCTSVCCPDGSETCFDENYNAESCAPISDGGCECDKGYEKCGADPSMNLPGFCTTGLCCLPGEDYCFDPVTWEATSCVPMGEMCPSITKIRREQ